MTQSALRLETLRSHMAAQSLDVFLVPRADEYLGEYIPAHNERLRWLSGFTGSAGMALVLADSAAIFVDGRYTIQVREQVSADCFEYLHLNDEPPIAWLCAAVKNGSLKSGLRVGIDARLHTGSFFRQSLAAFSALGISLIEVDKNLVDLSWQDRPLPTAKLAMLLSERYAGESSLSKRRRMGQLIAAKGCDLALIAQLDSIAWLLNIRGLDVPRLPVVLGTAVLAKNGDLNFFTDPRKLANDFSRHVGPGVSVLKESQLSEYLVSLGETDQRVLIDENTCNAFVKLRLAEAGCTLISADEPVILAKAVKNSQELKGMADCHLRDGAALSSFLAWLDAEVLKGNLYDEAELSDKLEAYRRKDTELHDLSFDTISAAGPNGAMCHYDHRNGMPANLTMNSLYLLDSGGQYSDGTTDVTRTVLIGEASAEHRHRFTLVLKGHIALARAVFPKGTCGVQLDVLARQFLWQAGLDYDHGTGHGVGAFLSVHEGPQGIGKSPTHMGELFPGMILTNEPGYYKSGEYGIRCENVMQIISRDDGMMMFEALTFVPFDNRLIDVESMTDVEIKWLNDYHQTVNAHISPRLEGTARRWLQAATRLL